MTHKLILESLKKNNPELEFTGVEVDTIPEYQTAYQARENGNETWVIVDEDGQIIVDDLKKYRQEFKLSFSLPR